MRALLAVAAAQLLADAPGLHGVLVAEVNTLQAALPATASSLVTGLTATGVVKSNTTSNATFLAELARAQLPAAVVTKFRELTLATSVKFEAFHVQIAHGAASGTWLVGAARRTGATVEWAYVSAVASGHLVQQTQQVSHCHHCWLVAHCCHHSTVNRGMTTAEVQEVQQALEATAHKQLLASLPSTAELVALDRPDALALLKQAVAAEVADLARLERKVAGAKASTTVEAIVGRGFTVFDTSGDVQQLSGVPTDKVDELAAMVAAQMQVPAAFSASLHDVVQEAALFDDDAWHMWQLVFAASQGSCRYATLLSRKASPASLDLFVASFSATFAFAPDMFVYTTSKSVLGGLFSSSSMHIRFQPHALSTSDLQLLFDFFDIVATRKFAQVLAIPLPASPSLAIDTSLSAGAASSALTGNNTDLLSSAIDQVLAEWNKVVAALKSSESTSITQELMNRGFSSFLNAGQVQRGDGLPAADLGAFVQHLQERLQIPPERQTDFKDVLEELQWFDDNTWVMWKVAFDMNHQGKAKYVCLLSRHRAAEQKYDFLIADIEQTFAFAPDLFIMREQKSVLGGIWSSDKVKFKYVPHPASQNDIEFVFDYFTLIAFKRFAQILNLANIPADPDLHNGTAVVV